MDFTDFVDFTSKFEYSFGGGGLARIYVSEDSDVAITSKVFHNLLYILASNHWQESGLLS
jgi:hypothetical protein